MYQSFTVGEKFRVLPPGHTASTDGRVDLIMQRGAFGSGEHETTISCLEFLETLEYLQGRRVLDLGSGTGILAIAALKLGAASVLCVDISPEAVESARINCEINKVSDRASHMVGTLANIEEDPFDLILANIYGDILLSLAAPLTTLTASKGDLLLSGILWEYNFAVRHAYQKNNCELLANRMLEEFSSLWLRKSTG